MTDPVVEVRCGIPAHDKYETKIDPSGKFYHLQSCEDHEGDTYLMHRPCEGNRTGEPIPVTSPAWMWNIMHPWRWVDFPVEEIDPDQLGHNGKVILWSSAFIHFPIEWIPRMVPSKHANTPGDHGFPPLWLSTVVADSHQMTHELIKNGADIDYVFDGKPAASLKDLLKDKGREHWLTTPFEPLPNMNPSYRRSCASYCEINTDRRCPRSTEALEHAKANMVEFGYTAEQSQYVQGQLVFYRLFRAKGTKEKRAPKLLTLQEIQAAAVLPFNGPDDLSRVDWIKNVHPQVLGIVLSATETATSLRVELSDGMYAIKYGNWNGISMRCAKDVIDATFKDMIVEDDTTRQGKKARLRSMFTLGSKDTMVEAMKALGFHFRCYDADWFYFDTVADSQKRRDSDEWTASGSDNIALDDVTQTPPADVQLPEAPRLQAQETKRWSFSGALKSTMQRILNRRFFTKPADDTLFVHFE